MALVPHNEDPNRKEVLKKIEKDLQDKNVDRLKEEHNVNIGVNDVKANSNSGADKGQGVGGKK